MLLAVMLCASHSACWFARKPARPTSRTPPPPPPRAAAKKKAATKPRPAVGKQEPRATREQPKPNMPEIGPPPALGQMLGPEERAQLTQSLDRNLSDARQAVSRLSGHALTSEQSQSLSLVQSLLAQADKARHTDLAIAAELARRARLLARDLATSMH